MAHQILVQVLVASIEVRVVYDLLAISLLQFGTGILASFVIIQVTVHLCIAI